MVVAGKIDRSGRVLEDERPGFVDRVSRDTSLHAIPEWSRFCTGRA